MAQVARDNGFNVITADVMQLDPHTLEVPDVLHASPVCKRASGANQSAELNEDGTKEAPEDIEMGGKIAQFIDVMAPRIVTIENVYAYRNFKAFKLICNALDRGGYWWDFDNLNAADYGVPQTRRRLILRAIRGALLPNLPQPERWVGWYEAIEDLIPGLPESRFAAWQLERLPYPLAESIICNGTGSGEFGISPRFASEPVGTIKSSDYKGIHRAFLISDQSAHAGQGVQVVDDSAPFFPIRAGENGGSYPKAWLVESKNNGQFGDGLRADREPATTITTDPKESHRPKAWLSQGRVVSMTPRALARFQSLPDSYILPESKSLACKVIGNGVCPLLYEKIIGPLAGLARSPRGT